jgi:hypothetical protein
MLTGRCVGQPAGPAESLVRAGRRLDGHASGIAKWHVVEVSRAKVD